MLINNIDLTPYLRIKKITGRGMIKNEIVLRSTASNRKTYYQKKRRPPRILGVEADIKADNEEELRQKIDELNGILNVDKVASIIFKDENQKEYFGIPEASDEDDDFIFMHKGKLKIVCPDPNKYGRELTPSFSSGSLSLEYNATAEAYPTLKATANGSMDSITISNGEESLKINYGFIAGDTLTVDFNKNKVMINDIVNMPTIDLNNPNFFPIKRGLNNWTISPNVTANLELREVWL